MKRNGFTVMARLIGLVRPLTGYMVLAVAMGLAGHLCAALITVLGAWAVLEVLGFTAPSALPGLFAAMAVCALLRAGLRYGEQTCNHYIAFKLLARIRDLVFQALRRLCPAKLEGKDKGDLISVITSDIELLEVFYAHTISPIAIALLFSALLCLFIWRYHWLLGLLALAAYLIMGAAVPLTAARRSGDAGMRFRRGAGELSSCVLESLRGLPELQQYGQGERRLEEMMGHTERLAAAEGHMKRIAGQNTASGNTVILCFDLLMLFTSAMLFRHGAVGFDGVVLPTAALMSSFGPTAALAGLGSTLQSTFAAGNRVLDILEESPVVEERAGLPGVIFRGADAGRVTFSYGGETVLRDVSVDVPEGQIVGITGRSGSGKSTLLKLFMRFWDVQEGEIRLSERPVSGINTADLREMESFVTQETHLFHDSIRSNLCIARPDADDAAIEAACRKASVHDFICSLPQGYDTPVGELGDRLSGGERQRLGLARAFLHDAPFLLLDEPTSNLDSLNEAVILRSLREEGRGRTVLLVSHRKSTMRIADKVYSVEDGRVS